ncbi:MAG: ShlB/FhaC/HecB family hemolysin secretion/activation protein [Pseudomonadota bacterium]
MEAVFYIMNNKFLNLLVVSIILLISTSTQSADVFPGHERLPDAEFPSELPSSQFVLPPVEAPILRETPISPHSHVFVRSFQILGNTVLDSKELEDRVKSYIGNSLSAADLKDIAGELTQLYVTQGYINSGVILPDQEIVDGVVTFIVIEGVLSQVEVRGVKNLKPKYLLDRVSIHPHVPLNLTILEERLQLLRTKPLIERVDGKLLPGKRLGESVLIVSVEESQPYRLEFTTDNHRSPSVGSIQGGIHAAHLNLTGMGDVLDFHYNLTEGADNYGLAYQIPVTPRDTIFGFSYSKSDALVIEEPFDNLDVESEVSTWRLALDYPIVRSLSRTLMATLRFDKRHSESFLLSQPFSFDPAVQDGESDITVLRIGLEWQEKSMNQVIALRSVFSKGLHILGASRSDNGADGRFLTWLGQFQWARLLGSNRNELIFRTDIQYAWDPLLPIEKFPVGGAFSVRGYRENQFVRDNGLVSSLELRFPLVYSNFRWPKAQFAVFGDYGRSWNKENNDPEPTPIMSAGAGLRFDLSPKTHGEVYYAHAFETIDSIGDTDTLQDNGIHFFISYRPL